MVGDDAVFPADTVSVPLFGSVPVPTEYVTVTTPLALAVKDAGVEVKAVDPTLAVAKEPLAGVKDRYTVAPPIGFPYWSSAVNVTGMEDAPLVRLPVVAMGVGDATY